MGWFFDILQFEQCICESLYSYLRIFPSYCHQANIETLSSNKQIAWQKVEVFECLDSLQARFIQWTL